MRTGAKALITTSPLACHSLQRMWIKTVYLQQICMSQLDMCHRVYPTRRVYNNGLINRARFSHIFSVSGRFIHSTCDKRSLAAKYFSSCSLSRAVTSAS
jgi:hypothetical protein